MKLKIDVFAAIILGIVQCTFSDHIPSCNVANFGVCPGDNQRCIEATSECVCIDGFSRVGDECTQVPGYASHDTTAAVVSIFTIALIVCGLVLVVRKYKLIGYVRQRINSRRNNDIMYEDVMIGHDDPPLSPVKERENAQMPVSSSMPVM